MCRITGTVFVRSRLLLDLERSSPLCQKALLGQVRVVSASQPCTSLSVYGGTAPEFFNCLSLAQCLSVAGLVGVERLSTVDDDVAVVVSIARAVE